MGELRQLIAPSPSMSNLTDARCVRSPEVLWRRTTSGALVVVPSGGELLQLNHTASLVWDELAEPCTVRDVVDAIAGACGEPAASIERDIEQVLGQLVGHGVVWSAG